MSFCSGCGAKLGAAKFCGQCGAKVASEEKPQRRQFVVHARNEKPVVKVDDGRPLDSKLRREFNENVKQSYGEGYGNVFSYGDVEMPKEVNTQGNDLQDAWKQLTQGKIDWMLFGFKNIKKDGGALEIKATGTKGLKEYIKAHEAFQHTFLFGCFRVVGMDRAGGVATKRVRYVYTTFVGNGVPEKMRAQFNPLKTQVEKFFGTVQMVLHMTGTSLDLDLSPNQLGFKLHNSSGSHKSELYDFGGGLTVDAKEFTHADAEESDSDMSDFD